MAILPTLDDEVTFLTGVTADGKIAATSYRTWTGTNKPAYEPRLSEAVKWGPEAAGKGATASYFFATASTWSDVEKMAWEGGLALWSAVANIQFTEARDADSANFVIERGKGGAFARFGEYFKVEIGDTVIATPPAKGSVVSIDTNDESFGPITGDITIKKGYPLSTLVHELGHIIGLGHGGPYNLDLDKKTQQYSTYDTLAWTLMSYIRTEDDTAGFFDQYPVKNTDWNGYEPMTPMMLDILEIQRLYGAATKGPLVGGGHTFGFNTNISGYIERFYDFAINTKPIVTLWDSGKNNTLDLSKFADGSTVSLVPGTYSSAAGYVNNIAVAYDTVIEKAIGGDGNDTIRASDVASTLVGGKGNDTLLGGAGDDVLSGGPGADRIDGGGGHNTLRDTLADMNGDTIVNIGSSTGLQLSGLAFGLDSLKVTPVAGGVTLDIGTTSLNLTGSFDGGTFMAVARGAGGSATTDVSFAPFLPSLVEGVQVAAAAINGIVNTAFLRGDGTTHFTATLEGAFSAFGNAIGAYRLADSGAIAGVHLMFANTHAVAVGTTLALDTPAGGESLGFFLVQDAASRFGLLPDDLSFADIGGRRVLSSASLGLLDAATVFHAGQAFNPGNAIQVLSGVSADGRDLRIGFEDLPNGQGDNDFQDVVIRVHTDRDGLLVL